MTAATQAAMEADEAELGQEMAVAEADQEAEGGATHVDETLDAMQEVDAGAPFRLAAEVVPAFAAGAETGMAISPTPLGFMVGGGLAAAGIAAASEDLAPAVQTVGVTQTANHLVQGQAQQQLGQAIVTGISTVAQMGSNDMPDTDSEDVPEVLN